MVVSFLRYDTTSIAASSGFEQEDGNLSKVEVDKMFRLMRDVGTKVPAHDAVPRRVVLLVKFLLDEGRNVLLNVVLLQRLGGTVDRILLHVLRHVRIFDHCLTVRHGLIF